MREFDKLKLDCWTLRWVGYYGPSTKFPGEFSLLHNYIFASVGESKDDKKGAVKDCGKVLDPWRNGKPDFFEPDGWDWHWWNYAHNSQNDLGWLWDGTKWVPKALPGTKPWTPREPPWTSPLR
jgi:hypothetical protein